jgi:hypothetical protein
MRRFVFLLLPCLALAWVPAVQPADKDVPEGFEPLFNGKDLTGWKVHNGKMDVWGAEDGLLFVKGGGGGWLMTEKEYSDFEVRLEYKMPRKGNSGVAIRSPLEGDPAYTGMEIQLLDDETWAKEEKLRPEQFTGSIYDVVAPSKQVTKPFGEWNKIRITAKGRMVTVELNGTVIVDANLDDYKDRAKKHPGLLRDKGHIGLQSYNFRVDFRNLSVKPL